jgi:hypothetical protein
VWSPAGRRLLPPAQLSAPPSALAARGWRLLSLTADGGVKVYDIAERALALPAGAGGGAENEPVCAGAAPPFPAPAAPSPGWRPR